MSKPQLSFRVPNNMEQEIENFQERHGIEDRSEAARQVVRRGLDGGGGPTPGERLLETATGVAGVAAVGSLFVRPSLAPMFGLTAFVLALLWASIMVRAGRDLV
jgi:hypothetical protein